MGMLTNLIDRLFEASWNRRRAINALRDGVTLASAPIAETGRSTAVARQFTVRTAMNGEYIEFTRHRWNPKGPDDYENCVYIVREGETLVDAISTVLVLMDKAPEV